MSIPHDSFQSFAMGGKRVSTDCCAARLQFMARMVQRDDVTVCYCLLQPNQQDQRCFHKHSDHPSNELGIATYLEADQEPRARLRRARQHRYRLSLSSTAPLTLIDGSDQLVQADLSVTISALPMPNLRTRLSIACSRTVSSASSTSNAVSSSA